MRKLITIIFIVFMILFVGCNNNDNSSINNSPANNSMNTNQTMDTEDEQMEVFNASTLSVYNGKDGNPAYIAIEGVVYDVSDEPMWMDGIHQGRFQAGQDLTEQMKNAPHGLSKLTGLKEVGTYED